MMSFRCLVVYLLLNGVVFAEQPTTEYLQTISVTIVSANPMGGTSEGSGVTFYRKRDGGDGVTFIWTAAHVVENLRTTRTIVDPKTGTERTVVEFGLARVVKRLIEDGQTVGRAEMDAEVVRYSDSEHGEDLAILRVLKKNYITDSAKFRDSTVPPLGTNLYHVGSLLGQVGSNSLTDGIISQVGRRLPNKKIFDQTTATAFPGSSGGGVFVKENGEYIGMLVRGAGEGFNLIVPVRRMRAWAKAANVEWAMDPKISLPADDELIKIPVEDTGKSFAGPRTESAKRLSEFNTLIRHIHD